MTEAEFWIVFLVALLMGGFAGSVGGFFFGWRRGNVNGNHLAELFWKRKIRE